MPGEIVLKIGDGIATKVNFGELSTDKQAIKTQIEMRLHPSLGGSVFQSIESWTSLSDWYELGQYLEQHIKMLLQNANHNSPPSFTRNWLVQYQAFAGDVTSETEGTFTLSFMINVGSDPLKGNRVYLGCTSLIYFNDIQDFILSLQTILNQS